MSKPKILLQLDTDAQPSVFDAVVALDAGAEHLLRHGGVSAEGVRPLLYGGMFTRSPGDLAHTAVFIGGSDVAAAEKILEAARQTFFGPLRMSILLDAGGCNTTAAAAVLVAARHLALADTTALVLGATGPVGQRVVRLLAGAQATVRVGSRSRERAAAVCGKLTEQIGGGRFAPFATETDADLSAALDGAQLVIAAGAPGAALLPAAPRRDATALRVAIDLNAVPPSGIIGIDPPDKAKPLDGILAYGAIGVGGLKMKIHKAAIARLFESNEQILDAEEVYQIGVRVESAARG